MRERKLFKRSRIQKFHTILQNSIVRSSLMKIKLNLIGEKLPDLQSKNQFKNLDDRQFYHIFPKISLNEAGNLSFDMEEDEQNEEALQNELQDLGESKTQDNEVIEKIEVNIPQSSQKEEYLKKQPSVTLESIKSVQSEDFKREEDIPVIEQNNDEQSFKELQIEIFEQKTPKNLDQRLIKRKLFQNMQSLKNQNPEDEDLQSQLDNYKLNERQNNFTQMMIINNNNNDQGDFTRNVQFQSIQTHPSSHSLLKDSSNRESSSQSKRSSYRQVMSYQSESLETKTYAQQDDNFQKYAEFLNYMPRGNIAQVIKMVNKCRQK